VKHSSVVWLVVAACLSAIPVGLSAAGLDESFTVRTGDWVALQLWQEVATRNAMRTEFAPTATYYDSESKKVFAEVYGQRPSVEGARGTLSLYETFISSDFNPNVKSMYGLALTTQDYVLVYYDRSVSGAPKEVVRLTGGQYVVPSGKQHSGPAPRVRHAR